MAAVLYLLIATAGITDTSRFLVRTSNVESDKSNVSASGGKAVKKKAEKLRANFALFPRTMKYWVK